jgi:hypothetical protein
LAKFSETLNFQTPKTIFDNYPNYFSDVACIDDKFSISFFKTLFTYLVTGIKTSSKMKKKEGTSVRYVSNLLVLHDSGHQIWVTATVVAVDPHGGWRILVAAS